jgi:hypothetical protein
VRESRLIPCCRALRPRARKVKKKPRSQTRQVPRGQDRKCCVPENNVISPPFCSIGYSLYFWPLLPRGCIRFAINSPAADITYV